MTQEQPPNSLSNPETVQASPLAQSPHGIGFFPSLGILLLELVLPVTMAGLLLYWLSGVIPLWSLNRVVALVIFALVLIALSLSLSVLIDFLTLPMRKRSLYKKIINPVGSRPRQVKFILVGVLIPAGLFTAANLVALPQGGTPMALMVRYSQLAANISPVAEIGDAVLSSNSLQTKIEGIKTLQAVHSPDSLEQLFRILTTDPAALNDAGEYEALSTAIASFGTAAKPGLFDLNSNADQLKFKPNVNPSQDTFSWYFSASFDELRKDVQAQNPDKTSREAELARLASAETALQQALTNMSVNQPGPSASASATDFIVHTFLAMEVKRDNDLLQFAKTIAADSGYTDSARGAALLLIAKSGGKSELNELYTYLSSNDEFIKAKALEAIASLQSSTPASSSSK